MLVAVAPAAGATPFDKTPRVLTASGTTSASAFQRKPDRIIYSGDGAALLAGSGHISNNLKWTSWTAQEGRGSGADWIDNCKPNCASGKYTGYKATIRVYRPEHVGGHLLFTRMTVTYTGTRPPYPGYRHGSVTYKLHYKAKVYFWA